MKTLVVSGFLGAGKTTFIKELVNRFDARFAVLENEYGDTDVDQQVLQAQDKADVWDLSEGCVCCTKSADLNASVMTIESALQPEVLIIEPSGVGALSNVMRNLRKIEYERIRLLRPVTIVDAQHFGGNRAEFTDVYEDQIRASGTVLISKPDNPDAQLLAWVRDCVKELNPDADVLPRHYTDMPREWWESLLATAYDGQSLSAVDEPGLDLETYTVHGCSVESPATLLCLLEWAVRGRFGRIVRAKGILPAGNDWVGFDVVDGAISIAGLGAGSPPHEAECVWIGQAIDRLGIRNALRGRGNAH